MGIVQTVRDSVVMQLGGVWTLALVIAYLFASQTTFSIVQVAGLLVMLGSLGILTLQFRQTVREPDQPRAEGDDSEEAVIESDEESTSSRVTATSGLSPTERRVQNELIRTAYRSFAERPLAFMVTRQAPHLVEDVADAMEDVDEEMVERVWRFSKDDGFFERSPGSNSLRFTPKAVWRAEELGEEILLDEAVRDEILDVLMAAYRENPTYPRVGRDELIEAVGFDEDEVDHNLWLLAEKGFVETHSAMGASAGYHEVEITDLGREVI